MKQKIVVFGATGNLGAYFIDHLINHLDSDKYEIIASGRRPVYNYDFKNVTYIPVDITKPEDFKNLPSDNIYAVVDFAGALPAYTKLGADNYIKTNINGTLNILEYCRQTHADRIIYMQTWADLNGYLKDKKPLKPDWPRKPILTGDHAIYCATKCTAVDLLKIYNAEYGIKDFVFRLPNIYLYTPDEYYYVNGEKKLISYRYMIKRAMEGLPIECWGDKDAGKDIIYVKDLCGMIYNALFVNRNSGIYNAGTGVKTTMEDQIKGFIKVFSPKDHPSEIIYKPDKPDCDDFVMDIQNIKDELNYTPQYDYLKYLEDYKKEMQLNRFERKAL